MTSNTHLPYRSELCNTAYRIFAELPIYVAGYYMTFTTARSMMDKLQIDDRLEFPINNWLAEQNKLTVLAGAIAHPVTGELNKEDGILIMTQFFQLPRGADEPVTDERVEQDIREVKGWLVNEGGVKPDELEWMTLWDHFNLTRCGNQPERNNIHGRRCVIHKTMSPEMTQRWENSRKGLVAFWRMKGLRGGGRSNQ